MRVKRIELLNQLTKLEKVKTECLPESQYKCECSVCQDIRKIGNQLMVLVPPRRYIWAEYADEALRLGVLTPRILADVLKNEGGIYLLAKYVGVSPYRLSVWIKDKIGYKKALHQNISKIDLEKIRNARCQSLNVNKKQPELRVSKRGKFTADQVRDMRKLKADGTTYKAIAEKYGVGKTAVIDAVRRRTYKWVD